VTINIASCRRMA